MSHRSSTQKSSPEKDRFKADATKRLFEKIAAESWKNDSGENDRANYLCVGFLCFDLGIPRVEIRECANILIENQFPAALFIPRLGWANVWHGCWRYDGIRIGMERRFDHTAIENN